MQYSKYENFSTHSAASETTNAMDKLDDAGKTDDGRKEEFKIIGGKIKKKSKSQKKRKSMRKTKKSDGINYTYTVYMLPNKEIIEIIEYDNKRKKNIKNNYNDIQDMKEYYNALTKINNIPCTKNELHPKKLIKK